MSPSGIPGGLLRDLEAVYGEYTVASRALSTVSRRDRAVMARVSADLGTLWRRVAAVPGLEWWVFAAVSAAAEAFEQQAAAWSNANTDWPAAHGPAGSRHGNGGGQ